MSGERHHGCPQLRHIAPGGHLRPVRVALQITPRTARFHQHNVLTKIGAESRLDILRTVECDAPCQTVPTVTPGAEVLLHVDGWPKVERMLQLIDAIEARGIDPIERGLHVPAHGLKIRPASEQLLQMVHVSMMEDAEGGPAQAAAVDEAGVAKTVGEDQSVFSDQRRNHADIGQVSGGKGEGRFCAFETSEGVFEHLMGC